MEEEETDVTRVGVNLHDFVMQWRNAATTVVVPDENQRRYWTIYETEDQVEKKFSTLEEYQSYLKRTNSKGVVELEEDLFTA